MRASGPHKGGTGPDTGRSGPTPTRPVTATRPVPAAGALDDRRPSPGLDRPSQMPSARGEAAGPPGCSDRLAGCGLAYLARLRVRTGPPRLPPPPAPQA